jgi:hypothetical protein
MPVRANQKKFPHSTTKDDQGAFINLKTFPVAPEGPAIMLTVR